MLAAPACSSKVHAQAICCQDSHYCGRCSRTQCLVPAFAERGFNDRASSGVKTLILG